MSILADRLRNRVEVWAKVKTINALKQTEYVYAKTYTVWAEITYKSGQEKTGEAGTEYANVSYRITVRKGSIPDLNATMYLVYQGQRYDISHYQPNYKYNDCIEIYAKLKVK